MMARVLAVLLLLAATATTSSTGCPHGWTDGSQHGMGCLLFNHTRDRQASFLTYKVVSLSGIAYKVQTKKKTKSCLFESEVTHRH